jgi:hypothetical protein
VVPESTEAVPSRKQRTRIAAAIRAELAGLDHLVEMLRIGVECPDPESCLSTVDTLRRRSADLARTIRRLNRSR